MALKKPAAAAPKPARSAKAAPPVKAAAGKAAAPAKAAGSGKSADSGKAPAPATVTLKHLAAELADTHGMPRKQTDGILTDMIDLVVNHLKQGDRIRIGGLGILEVKKRAARMGRNPATGQEIQIAASKKVAFRASKDLKEAV